MKTPKMKKPSKKEKKSDLYYNYEDVKSKFILEKMKKTKWKNRGYIDDLIKIERAALGRMQGMWSGYTIVHLKGKYPKEWKIIHMELVPKQYRRTLREEKDEDEKECKEMEEFKRQERTYQKKLKKEWLARGGKA